MALHNNENGSEILSETVFRSNTFVEVDGSSILLCRAEVVWLSQNVASIDFQCLKDIDFIATFVLGGGGGSGRGTSISRGSGI